MFQQTEADNLAKTGDRPNSQVNIHQSSCRQRSLRVPSRVRVREIQARRGRHLTVAIGNRLGTHSAPSTVRIRNL